MVGLIFGRAYLIDWASLIAGRKFTVFALFCFVFEDNFQVQAPGGLYLEGRSNGGFFALRARVLYLKGLILGFYGMMIIRQSKRVSGRFATSHAAS